jgi:hypothetical protein
MKIEVASWVETVIEYFWTNKTRILSEEADEVWQFDYPDYGGLPKKISNQFTSAFVDIIQSELIWALQRHKNKKAFAKNLLDTISNGVLVVK